MPVTVTPERRRNGHLAADHALDASLIAAMASGDQDATAAFVRRYHARVYGLALTVVADPGLAEEVAQDAFVRVWRHAAGFDPRRGSPAAWLLTITRNVAVDAVRLRRDLPIEPDTLGARPSPSGEAVAAGEPGWAGADGDPERAERLSLELRGLPPEQSRLLVLAVCYGFTAKEIAEREGIPLGTAKTRIRRGLARLRRALRADAA
ncbi:putative RNA polymerase sigma E protein [Sphaerisporangium melleum]|uniref:RNA polymerase sigma factor n=1 Tax=Sphaerisporangium melleum TaxID=321316 RepID=A0A917RR20_9ACTN|nr:sigma-70 family RNA polymerase sigma factor [Sphaerisporangium melleum]GGL20388.1 putative RNA polymerase sigma E protein [Sphaerisporangium melleum]GII74851.1 putative RNA polymerase sigma E protein [Sphaerisporangium melleum]